jgi:NAD(P)-dependent dehydrogenase (short-subunit alcohol dehydrogenase family)
LYTEHQTTKIELRNLFSLEGKTAIVSGGTGLIGRTHCEALSMAGANVVIADISESSTQDFANELGKNALGISIDVTDAKSLENAKQSILSRFGTIDILVNNV